ncbi:DUF5688 family protein [Parasporobacterium paucivorans]|uniref:Uncharacterized protein n=1 Tax=Parasporobacterium paucivorans DSM 15970 TaxID=1122934 RepID=A0A1M6AZN3_9FIRM|nr:DUF5688 family protein [Parasporobacterium paucivorans]SHI41683.1 hypothetical protein SAMN02745691_00217 [Parasporobacterium paucivorans DSM 15970]
MEYREFLQAVKEEVEKQVPGNCSVRLDKVLKNNGKMLDAITVMEADRQMAPTIYLNDYFKEVVSGRSVKAIAEEIIDIYNDNKERGDDLNAGCLDFVSAEFQIVYRLINNEMNRERLKDLPHKIIEDMAKVYYVVVKSDEEGTAYYAVTQALLENWKVGIDRIDELANKNTPNLFPEKLRSMNEIMKELIREQFASSFDEDDNTYADILSQLIEGEKEDRAEMYVLSNAINMNGASVLLYPGVLHNFAVEQKSDIYILPSSIHEAILLPASGNLSKESLRQMVREVNGTQVPVEEILSNEVYYYDLALDEFHIAED